MGATSVTGVSGVGTVAGIQKGSPNMSLGVERLIGPRVVAAGTCTVGAGSGATVGLTVTSGVITSVAVVAAGSGYAASSVFYLAVTGGNGVGGVVTATTGTAGTITSMGLLLGGSTYTATTASTGVTGVVFLPESTITSPNPYPIFDSPASPPAPYGSSGVGGDDGLLGSGAYIASANDTNPTPAAVNVVALTTNYLVLAGTAGHVLSWMIVKSGFQGNQNS